MISDFLFHSVFKGVVITLLLFSLISLTPYLQLAYQVYENPIIFDPEQEEVAEPEAIPESDTPNNNENENDKQEEILYYAECLHGGVLLTGEGNSFQYSTYYILDRLFEALEQYNDYKVCLELEPSTMPLLNQTYVDRLKKYIKEGRVEIVFTSFDQNFLLNVSYDFALYSLKLAKETIESVFNYTPKVFAAQEMALRPDLPQLLNEVGITYVLGRVWMSYWGNMEYWKEENNQDILIWNYNDSSVHLIPGYHNINTWDFSEGYVEELINKAHDSGINHPLQISFDDLGWHKDENETFPFFHQDNELVQFVTLTEYIEEIADSPEIIVEIPQCVFKLKLPDAHNYTNWEGVALNKTQFQIIVNGTQELETKWLELYKENKTNPLVEELFVYVSRLYFHDIWVCYNYAFGSCIDEGFENWFEYWRYYADLALTEFN